MSKSFYNKLCMSKNVETLIYMEQKYFCTKEKYFMTFILSPHCTEKHLVKDANILFELGCPVVRKQQFSAKH